MGQFWPYRHLTLSVCMFLFSGSLEAGMLLSALQPQGVADGLLVKFKTNTSHSSQMHALSASGLRAVSRFELVPGLTHVKQVAGENLVSTLSSIQSDPNVEYAEPNYFVTIEQVPDDPKFSSQYGLENSGQTGGTPGADISATKAWAFETGGDVVVAVIDTGVDYTHSELRLNMWKNPGEISGNGLDDDNNGFVDDIYGWDFSNNDSDPMDDMGHGTHVAGIIAAQGNNGIGISGVNWRARIMALKFIDANGIGTTSKAIKALNYAVAMGARVSNNSWGGGAFSQALFDAISAAQSTAHMFVAASGNTGIDTDDPTNNLHYPSSYPLDNVISVTATDEFDRLGGFSNYGAVSVDLAAPGMNINSLWINNSYMVLDGTSMAAPFVTGAVALLWAKKTDLPLLDVRSAILNNVDPIPSLSGLTVTGGRLNLHKAMMTIASSVSISPQTEVTSVGDQIFYTATGGVPPYKWSVDDTAVAEINSNSGALLALSAGNVEVTVTDSLNFSATQLLTVEDIIIQPEVAILNVGEQLSFSASGGRAPYTWTSSNPQIASVGLDSGVLTGVAAGQVQVIVKDANNISTRSGDIIVQFIPSMNILPSPNLFFVGETFQFELVGGVPPYQWQTSNSSVATIDSSALLTAWLPGTFQLQVTDSMGSVALSPELSVEAVQINVPNNSMNVNDVQRLSVKGGREPFEWFVSNSLVAKIDNFGNLSALSPGSVKVSLRDGNGTMTSTDIILVTDTTALNLTIPASILTINDIVNVGASGGVLPYRWFSSNPAVLQMNAVDKTVKAIGAGVAYISVEDAVGDRVSSAVIEVRNIAISSQRLSYSVGETEQFFASGGVLPYTWQVDNASLASISKTGFFEAKKPGVIVVGVFDSDGIRGESKSITISSNVSSLHTFSITPRSATLSKRSTSSITFMVDGGLPPYQFSLSKPVGNINPVSGEYIPKSANGGKTTIIVTDADGHVLESGTIEVR